jgi:sterol 3beta-glucosyltransferase
MKISLFAHGLRGDVWPMMALGWSLAQRDHDVTLAIPGEFREFAEQAGMKVVPLPLDLGAWLRTSQGQRLLQGGGVRLFRAGGRQYAGYAEAFDEAFLTAAQGAEALVGGLIIVDRALALGDHMGVPVAMLAQYPVAPSGGYPSVTMASASLRLSSLNRASGRFAYWLWRQNSEKPTFAFRRRLGLPAAAPPFYRLRDCGAPILHTFSRSLFPRPADWPANLAITGGWKMPAAFRESVGERLPADLESWLADGEPPVFLGFGSMPVLDPEPLLETVLSVTTALGLRAVVSENCVSDAAALPDHLRAVGAVDHDLLFPRCRAVVHHGGLGSTTASLRAGRPTMVCSVFADQPWWGAQVRRLGVGAHVPFGKLDRDSLERGLCEVLEPGVVARARAMGEAMDAEGDGLPEATELLEDWLATAGPIPLRAGRAPGASLHVKAPA